MNLEKELAENTTKAIEIDDKRSAERFYNQYLFYTRKVLKEFVSRLRKIYNQDEKN